MPCLDGREVRVKALGVFDALYDAVAQPERFVREHLGALRLLAAHTCLLLLKT
jgi:hypothetical protein